VPSKPLHDPLQVSPPVEQALDSGTPVVALESTVITHGLPRPVNLETARRMESIVEDHGAIPATVAVLDGRLRVGLEEGELDRLANAIGAVKISRRDLGPALALDLIGGTTVAATMLAAHRAGIRVFATGGIGGVHRGVRADVSADLPELARTPVAVICAGAKSILDLPRTLEWLETAGVPVIGWATEQFPAFFSRSSGLPVSSVGDDAAAIASILQAHWSLGLAGALVAVPVPADQAVDLERIEAAIDIAEQEADAAGVVGPDRTPFILKRLVALTDGASLQANLALLDNNAKRAAELAAALAVAG
jgi:pseudouridine-5'-phosphate glycosidase